MVVYLDASALIKLYFREEHSRWTFSTVARLRRLLGGAVATSVMGYVEARAAFARAQKRRPPGQRIPEERLSRALSALDADARERIVLRPSDAAVVERALRVAGEHALRGYDAVHLATALVLRDELRAWAEDADEPPEEVLLLTFDDELHDAALSEGIAHERPDRAGGNQFGDGGDGGDDEETP